ncbi:hypothetical protein [Bifidobacterium sp. ESL0704]|uniref:hypothetical protein n=1 Tax=Bifidobacterium sp. ESL0704 TaxID=2983219 RepID=UPI0023F63655|nr:hypothetical protein [Bifidobacterium sp. ESL0704]WEV53118.1 hypothetical protein OZX64_01050 [Bifidobacterium sp. ESL0704]
MRTTALEVIVVKGNDGYRRQEGLDAEHAQGVKRHHVAKAATCVFAGLIVLATLLATFNGSVLQTTASAASTTTTDSCSGDQYAKVWRSTECPTDPDGAFRKPVLYRLLAANNKIDTARDELRMDFVVRVAHDEVNPTAGSSPESIGMKIRYDFGDNKQTDSNGIPYPDYSHAMGYKNTYVDSSTSDTTAIKNANTWADNYDEYFTIPKIMHAGLYDYVTVSVQGDMNIQDETKAFWTNKDVKGNPGYNDGRSWRERVWVEVGPLATGSNNSVDNALSKNGWSWGNDNNSTTYHATDLLAQSPLAGDVSDSETVTAYPGTCYPSGVVSDFKTVHGCDIPNSWVGFDTDWPTLWSTRQANWGMSTDRGIAGPTTVRGNNKPPLTKPGVAPPNSFFVGWYNPALGVDSSDPCYQVTGFKYQWIGLKNNKWVPVDSLTPEALTVSNMPALGAGTNRTGFELRLPNAQGQLTSNISTGDFDKSVAFNSTKNYDGVAPAGQLIVPGAGNGSKAQYADGSIDFKKAKEDQHLDGYFKLVTWPVVNQACKATDPLRNPDPKTEGITDDMAKNNPSEVQAQIDKGWTIDTAYYDFDIARPAAPVVNPFPGYSDPKTRTVSGTGTKGYNVTVFAEDPKNPIDPEDVNNIKTRGREVGTVPVGDDGTWTIDDPLAINPDQQDQVRYHAWQADNTPVHVTSDFSNIEAARFQLSMNSNPSVKEVYAPHSSVAASGANAGKTSLPDGAKVIIKGDITSANHMNDKFSVFAVPQDKIMTASDTTGEDGSTTGSSDDTSNPVIIDGNNSMAPNGLHIPNAKYQLNCENFNNSAGSKDTTVDQLQDVKQIDGTGTTTSDGKPDPKNPARYQANWSCIVDPSVFPTKANPKGNVLYKVYAVLQDVVGGKPAIGRVVNRIIDMVPPIVKVTSVNRSIGVNGTVEMPEDATSPDIPDYVNSGGKSGAKVTVIWQDGSRSHAESEKDGTWHVDVPKGTWPGEFHVTAADRAGQLQSTYNTNSTGDKLDIKNNQSDLVKAVLKEPLPITQLPFTGGARWFGAMLLLAGVTVLLIATCISLVWFRSRGQSARHMR